MPGVLGAAPADGALGLNPAGVCWVFGSSAGAVIGGRACEPSPHLPCHWLRPAPFANGGRLRRAIGRKLQLGWVARDASSSYADTAATDEGQM